MIFIGIIGAVFLVDYFIKQQAEEVLDNQTTKKIANGKILLRKLYNPGILFGWFKGEEKITVIGTAMAMGTMIHAFFRVVFKRGKLFSKLGYAMIIGGGLNNLYERCEKKHVTDYFSFNVKCDKIRRMVFNVSDIFIIVGTVLVTLSKLFGSKEK